MYWTYVQYSHRRRIQAARDGVAVLARLTKESVAQSARDLIRTRGVSRFGIRELAQELGCQPAALYHYVPSKDHLVACVASDVAEALIRAVVDRSEPEGPPELRLEHAIAQVLGLADQEPHLWELLFLDPRTAAVGEQLRFRLREWLADQVTRWNQQIDPQSSRDSARTADVLLVITIGVGTLQICRPTFAGIRLAASTLVELVLRRM